uniref:Ig-like domain-containing protein n=1 Tax=Amphimedon queenslandica TaxID=400682 RepID=A0A1X7SL29_AMPQE
MNANLTNITWSPGGTTQAGVTSASLTVTKTKTYTCTAANDCGSVTASTVVRNTPAVNVTGSVAGIPGNGCSGAGSGKRICAIVGMSVTIRCAVSPGDTYTITGPGVSPSNNQRLTLTVADNNYGDFTCTSTNSCGSITDTIRLERADCEFRLTQETVYN